MTARMINSGSIDNPHDKEDEIEEANKRRVDQRERLNQTELIYG